jgi:hypothetical protein
VCTTNSLVLFAATFGCSNAPGNEHEVDPELDHLALHELVFANLNNVWDPIIVGALAIID